VTLLLSVAFLVACVAGIVAVWKVKQPVTDRASQLFTRADRILGTTVTSMKGVQEVMSQAQKSLANIQTTSGNLAGKPVDNNPLVKTLVRQTVTDLFPKVGDVRQTLSSVQELAVVANTVLDNLNEVPLVSVSRLDADRLEQASSQLTALASNSQQLSALLSDTNEGTNKAQEVSDKASAIAQVLTDLQSLMNEYMPLVEKVQADVSEARARLVGWIEWGSIIITAVLAWLALSQLSMLCHGWGLFKR
jgi:hypothetical protein